MFIGAVQQIFFPFEFIAHMVGIFNIRLKRAISNFQLDFPLVSFIYKQLILLLELVLLSTKITTVSIILITLISSCILFNVIILILGYALKINAFELSTEYLEPAAVMEILDEQNDIWRGYLLN